MVSRPSSVQEAGLVKTLSTRWASLLASRMWRMNSVLESEMMMMVAASCSTDLCSRDSMFGVSSRPAIRDKMSS